MKTNYRHGDVLIIPTKKKVQGEPQKKAVLALGEVTGHSHQMTSGKSTLFRFKEEMYLRVTSKRAALTHEEHAKIELPAGEYEVVIQRDYIPGGWTKVID